MTKGQLFRTLMVGTAFAAAVPAWAQDAPGLRPTPDEPAAPDAPEAVRASSDIGKIDVGLRT